MNSVTATFDICEYDPSMRGSVSELTKLCGHGEFPKWAGGLGLVAFRGSEIVGFIWALTYPGSSVAYVDYFCVQDEHRHAGIGMALVTRMIIELCNDGVDRVVGTVLDVGPVSVVKMYHHAGMKVNAGMIVDGDPRNIVSALEKMRGSDNGLGDHTEN